KSKLQTFCNTIWPKYILGPQSLSRPKEGSVNIEEIKALTILNTQGKLEEELYSNDTNKKGGESLSPSHTRRGILYGGLDGSFTALLMVPLRELPIGNHFAYVHILFTTSDLFHWQRGMPPYGEAPQSYQVLEAAEKHYKAKRTTITNPPLGRWPQVADLLSPTFEINANVSIGMEVLREAQEAITQSLKKGVPKTINFSSCKLCKSQKKSQLTF
ncbi:hypothetical protein E2320_002296, partial [Naja naja]